MFAFLQREEEGSAAAARRRPAVARPAGHWRHHEEQSEVMFAALPGRSRCEEEGSAATAKPLAVAQHREEE